MEVNFKENKKEICKEGIMHCGKKSSDLWIYVEEEDLWFIWEAKCPTLSRKIRAHTSTPPCTIMGIVLLLKST